MQRHRAWGLDGADLSQAALAAWLTEQGYPVKPQDMKYAGRSALNEQVATASPDVADFLLIAKRRFPQLQVGRFYARPLEIYRRLLLRQFSWKEAP